MIIRLAEGSSILFYVKKIYLKQCCYLKLAHWIIEFFQLYMEKVILQCYTVINIQNMES